MDETGYFRLDSFRMQSVLDRGENQLDQRTALDEAGKILLSHLKKTKWGAYETDWYGESHLVEVFSEPLVVQRVKLTQNSWQVEFPYGLTENLAFDSFSLDEFDRFHSRSNSSLPILFSPYAQDQIFSLVDEYSDDALRIHGQWYDLRPYWNENALVSDPKYWNQRYIEEPAPPWELGRVSPPLEAAVQRLKLVTSRVLVLGAGMGSDAIHLAKQGHLVTAMDFSQNALDEAKQKAQREMDPSSFLRMNFVLADALSAKSEVHGQFDLIVEHTLYCAIAPKLRLQLTKTWRNLLASGGHLIGVFFIMDQMQGPPFGATEWEIRERLQGPFRILLWERCKNSIPGREAKELLVYAQKRNPS